MELKINLNIDKIQQKQQMASSSGMKKELFAPVLTKLGGANNTRHSRHSTQSQLSLKKPTYGEISTTTESQTVKSVAKKPTAKDFAIKTEMSLFSPSENPLSSSRSHNSRSKSRNNSRGPCLTNIKIPERSPSPPTAIVSGKSLVPGTPKERKSEAKTLKRATKSVSNFSAVKSYRSATARPRY